MDRSPENLGLIDDGRYIQLSIYTARPGKLGDLVDAWQREFKGKTLPGMRILFAYADTEMNRFIWACQFDKDVAEVDRWYLGKAPDIARFFFGGANSQAYMISGVDLPTNLGAPQTESTIELKMYKVKPGRWDDLFRLWRRIIELRKQAGFKVLFALADLENNAFVWAIGTDTDFEAGNANYLHGDERLRLNVISNTIAAAELPHVQPVPF
jgi:hypothetical protein